uniref:Uncharacterized protein n=1 Tax=Lotharella globosa TaxID=91324 RepID=A0A7S3Z0S7_9EUKA
MDSALFGDASSMRDALAWPKARESDGGCITGWVIFGGKMERPFCQPTRGEVARGVGELALVFFANPALILEGSTTRIARLRMKHIKLRTKTLRKNGFCRREAE